MAAGPDDGPRRRPRRRARWLLAGLLAPLLPPVIANAWILLATARSIHDLESAPRHRTAIVPGASVHRDRGPSNLLADRLDTAAALLAAGTVDEVLLSGDRDVERSYDEVAVMAAYLRDLGVPATAIRVDPHGYRTFDSAWRARRIYGIDDALIVTNAFHAPRAVWLARAQGIRCDGVAAPPSRDYPLRTRLWNQLREAAARTVAVLDVWVLDTRPRVPAGGG
ncbi:MAG: YdcF family protein [Planctomycetes bacterium]|nr:YdcF family protein [Planctomycetota bacterium]